MCRNDTNDYDHPSIECKWLDEFMPEIRRLRGGRPDANSIQMPVEKSGGRKNELALAGG
jgi:hypothetical protein